MPLATPAAAASPKEPKDAVRLVGRFDGARFAWSGSTIEARFIARSIAMRLRAAPLAPHVVKIGGNDVTLHEKTTTYAVRIDDRAPVAIPVSAAHESYTLAEDLDGDKPHEIAITRDAEAFAGVHELLGLDLSPGGRFLEPRTRPTRIEVVGDSIACGYGVLGSDARCPFTYATERASRAYPALLGRALDADVTTLCWSGRGVLRNYDGSTKETMPELFERALPAPPGVRWSFRAPPPTAVIVALGTNDFLGGEGRPLDLSSFESAYGRFLVRLREVYPAAWLFVATSPMLGPDPTPSGATPSGQRAVRDVARESLDRVVRVFAGRREKRDERVSLLDLEYQGRRVGCDYHPNAEMHRLLAQQAERALRERLDR